MASPSHHPRVDLTLTGTAGSHTACLAQVGLAADAFFGEGRHRIETISVRPLFVGPPGSKPTYEYDANVTDGTVEASFVPLRGGEMIVGTYPNHVCDFQPNLYTVECTICGAPA